MRIRKITAPDVEAVVCLWRRSMRRAYPYLPLTQAHTVEEDRDFFNGVIAARCDIWVAENGNALLGFLAIEGSYIDRLYIDPPHQRTGIGTTLLRHAMGRHPAGLELYTHQKNHVGRAFYEGHGFRAVEFGLSPPPENEPDVKYRWAATS